ncbi:MAG: nucleotidyltransferase family protein [Eubacterium sp.]|nr:nucleotidyltransferase family protein [Eubacterium sp.]
MKTAAVICELNPMHNGHVHLFDEIRRQSGARFVVALMSGDFVQRGAPAIMDKYERAGVALRCGADMVIEFPGVFALASADDFASGAVRILRGLGCIDTLGFGAECGDVAALERAAAVLASETDEYRAALKSALAGGLSYPAASRKALAEVAGEETAVLLDSPNNILAISYLKALNAAPAGNPVDITQMAGLKAPIASKAPGCPEAPGCGISPRVIERVGAGHGEGVQGSYPSSSYIRNVLLSSSGSVAGVSRNSAGIPGDTFESLRGLMPDAAYETLAANADQNLLISEDDLSALVHYRLSTLSREELLGYTGGDDGIAGRIVSLRDSAYSFGELCDSMQNRTLTLSRISRILTRIVLRMDDALMESVGREDALYARILGFRNEASRLVSEIKNAASIPVLTGLSGWEKALSPTAAKIITADILSEDIRRNLQFSHTGVGRPNAYQQPIIKF